MSGTGSGVPSEARGHWCLSPAFDYRSRLFAPTLALLILLSLTACTPPTEPPSELSWTQDNTSVALTINAKPVWQFQYGDHLTKPMFHPVSLTDGTILTWDAPPDHPWHHAFWFCWKYINGVNYWEEDRETGLSAGATTWSNVEVTTRPDYSASIAMDLSYQPPGEPPVLTERRLVEISAPATDGSYHFDWIMVFTGQADEVVIDRTPILGEPGGKAWGGYAGLSIRFAKELREWQAVSSNGPVERDTSVAFHAEQGPVALDFSGTLGARPAGIALLDHPWNVNAPTPWYIVMNPEHSFGFSEAALIYYQPIRLRAGDQFTLRYRAVVHTGSWDAAQLQSAQAEFVKEVDNK